MIKWLLILCALIKASNALDRQHPLSISPSEPSSPSGPLFLTPYLENGDAAGARRAAQVSVVGASNVTSFSGYFTINKKHNSNIFFRYYYAERNPNHAPVVTWSQGGPGYSSQMAILEESGPYSLNNQSMFDYRECRWCKNFHMVYFDFPFQVGFSFTNSSDDYPTSKEEYGQDLFVAVAQFFSVFPELLTHDYYAFGTCFGAKYVTALAKFIEINNMQNPQFQIPLKGLILESPFVDPISIFDTTQHLYELGLIEKRDFKKFKNLENQCSNLINQKQYCEATDVCMSIIDNMSDMRTLFQQISGYNYVSDVEETELDKKRQRLEIIKATAEQIRDSLHVGNLSYHIENTQLYRKYLRCDFMQSMLPLLNDLISKYRVLFFNDIVDLMFTYTKTTVMIEKMSFAGKDEFDRAEKRPFFVGGQLAGHVKSSKRLSQALVINPGQNTSEKQRCNVMALVAAFIANQV